MGPMFGHGHSAVHSTSSRERVDKYYTRKLRERVEAAYAADYAMMQTIGLLRPKPTMSDFLRTGEGLEAHLEEERTAGLATVSGYLPSERPVSGARYAETDAWRTWHANATAELARRKEASERREKLRAKRVAERERAEGEARRAQAFRGKVRST